MLAEGISGGFSSLYDSFAALETLGVARRGYFVEGLGAAQFALPGAVDRLRAERQPAEGALTTRVLAAADPANPYGASLAWPRAEARTRAPQRVAVANLVLVDGEPVVSVRFTTRLLP